METGSTRICVVPSGGGGWDLRETVAGPVLGGTGTEQAAVARATVMLEGVRGGEVVVLGADGTVRRRVVVSRAVRPWWYLRAGLLRWLVLPVLGGELALRVADPSSGPLEVFMTVVTTVLLGFALVVVVRSRALDRSRAAAAGPE